MLHLQHRTIIRLATILIYISGVVSFASEVCRLHRLEPFSKSYDRAVSILPNSTTSNPHKAVIYIEKTDLGVYYQSNFITPGFDYPTKIGSPRATNADTAFINILYAEMPSEKTVQQALDTFHNDVQVLVDKSIFDSSGAPLIDLSGIKNLKVVDGSSGKVLLDSLEQLERRNSRPLLISKVLGCCLYAIPPHLARRFADFFKQRQFNANEVFFMSLVRDSATDSAIKSSPLLRKARLGQEQPSDLAGIEASFQKIPGKTVILIGHVEGDNFVRRDSTGQQELVLPIRELRATARKYNIELIDLGCRTAQEIGHDALGFGVITRFNTLDAVRSIDRAMTKSTNYSDFFEQLTSEGLKVVVDREFVKNSGLRANVYSQSLFRTSPFWVKVAEIFVTLKTK